MKAIHIILSAIMSMVVATFAGAYAPKQSDAEQQGEVLTIRQRPVNSPNTPRTSAYNPFYAELEDSCVYVSAIDDFYGMVDLVLTSTAGDYYNTIFDTGNGLICIPFSGDEGQYTITLETLCGLVFEGVFEL